MKVLLAGPLETKALGQSTGIDLSDLPSATTQTPLGPLAGGLLAAGHQVHVLTMDPRIEEPEEHVRGPLTLSFVPIRGAPRYRARVRSRDLFAVEIAHLEAVMRGSDSDIIHANWTYEYAEAAIRSRRPMVATMHDLGWDILFNFRDMYRTLRLLMKYRAMLRVKALTAVAPFMARKAWNYGYFGQVDVIPNPIEPVPPRPKALDRPIIATIGNAGRLKNVVASVAAFARIRAALPSAELHLFGPGLDPEGQFRDAGPGVVCHGNVPHGTLMAFLEEEARLIVHPSRIEGCPVILGEAKMRGVPVVAGARSGGVEYVVGNCGGVLVDIEKPDEIADAALRILSNPAAYPALQQVAHEDVMARFATAQVTSRYVKVYERVLRATPR
ncbi:glycosyltransferase family 4 protein [Sphingomonas sp. NBWT7]|uniref:glycosyltransferase family 4 protein n=1 Tax=Sphingomonas sp. NBWT7 TaxID=2596913 RepID=UPI00162A990A|nr:glycosyltransferase family 4 protein [Sphingomonas sp. NBWT7]